MEAQTNNNVPVFYLQRIGLVLSGCSPSVFSQAPDSLCTGPGYLHKQIPSSNKKKVFTGIPLQNNNVSIPSSTTKRRNTPRTKCGRFLNKLLIFIHEQIYDKTILFVFFTLSYFSLFSQSLQTFLSLRLAICLNK